MFIKHLFKDMKRKAGKNPAYDWYVALCLFGIALCAIFAVNIYVLLNAIEAAPARSNTEQSSVTLRSENIKEAIKSIDQKKTRSESISRVLRADPSR